MRLFGLIDPPHTKRVLHLGNTYRPGFDKEIWGPESGRRVRLTVNKDGFRGPNRSIEKGPGVKRVAVLGDSMVASLNTDQKDTMPAMLEQRLAEEFPQQTWEVFNFGVSGASTGQEFNLYREVVEKYQVDLVVCAYTNANDFGDNCRHLSWNPRIYMDLDENGNLYTIYLPKIKRVSQWLNTHSRLYVWQKLAVNRIADRLASKGTLGKDNVLRAGKLIHVTTDAEPLEQAWRLNRKLIQEFFAYATRNGTSFLFVSLPDGPEFDDAQWQEYQSKAVGTQYENQIDRLHAETTLKDIVNEKDIPSIFLRERFVEQMQKKGEDHYPAFFQGRGHLNETGNRIFCDAVVEYLVQNGVVAKITAPRDNP